MDAHCTQGGLRKMASRWEDDDSSGTHLSTIVHLVPPTPNLASRHRATAAEGVPTRPSTTVSMAIAAQSIQLRSASHRPWTRGGANGGPSKDQPSLWRCWLQTELTFRTGSGFSARPRDGSEMRMAVLGSWSIELPPPRARRHGHTWNYHYLVVGTWTTVVPLEITKINILFCFPQ